MNSDGVECKCECRTNLERWKRFQQAAHLEKQWMNERLNWMLVPQGVLFAALGVIVNPLKDGQIEQLTYLPAMVSTLGIALALIGLVGAVAAGTMHYIWTTEVNKIADDLNTDEHKLVTFGMKPHWPARSTSVMPAVVAVAFFLTWAAFICKYFDTNITLSIGVILSVTIGFVFLIIACLTHCGNKKLDG